MNNIIPVMFQGRQLGWIDLGEKCYYSERNFKEHFFYKFDGYGLSENVLDKLEHYGIETIKLIIRDQHRILKASTSLFLVKGEPFIDKSFGKEDRQLILKLKYFNQSISTENQIALGVFQ